METITDTTTATAVAGRLPAGFALGPVHLVVTDLARAREFCETSLGLRTLASAEGTATMGIDEPVLELTEQPDARRAGIHAGLYHVALLYPSRLELAIAAARLAATRTPISGASDHGTHEAIYLSDPDGNGFELAADRPREEWPDIRPKDLEAIRPRPLDVHGLLAIAPDDIPTTAGPGLRVGHLHLHVGDIAEAARYWTEVVGFDELFRMESATFVSAGGYHHHLGMNTWKGEGIPTAPADTVGLRQWTATVPATADLDELAERLSAEGAHFTRGVDGSVTLRDPWNHELHVRLADDDGTGR